MISSSSSSLFITSAAIALFIALVILIESSHSASLSSAPKVALFQQCQRNEQCAAPDSFCGWSETDELSSVCMCRDGFKTPAGSSICVPIHRWCTLDDFNDAQRPGGGCPHETQFCRKNICLCKPNFVYDDSGNCIPDPAVAEGMVNGTFIGNVYIDGGGERPGFYRISMSDPAASALESQNPFNSEDLYQRIVDKIEADRSRNSSLMILIILGILFLTVIIMTGSIIFGVVYFRKYHQLKSMKAYQPVKQ